MLCLIKVRRLEMVVLEVLDQIKEPEILQETREEKTEVLLGAVGIPVMAQEGPEVREE